MLGLIIYIIAALCFIGAVVLLTFIPHKAARIVSLTMFCLLFIGGMTFLLFKASGQSDLGSVFDAMSGQTQSTGSIGSDVAATPDAVDTQPEQTAGVSLGDADTVTTPAPPAETPQPSQAQTPAETSSILGMWYEQGYEDIYQLEFNADGTMTYYEFGDPYNGTYTLDAATGYGEVILEGYTYDITYDAGNDILDFEGTYTRTPPDGSAGSDEDIVQMIVNDYLMDIAAMEYDNAFTYLTGRAADEYYPEIFYGEDFDYADWGMMDYSVSGDTATVSVRHNIYYTDGSSETYVETHHLVRMQDSWYIEYIAPV